MIVLNLLYLKIDGREQGPRELRYIILGPAEGLEVPAPLFLGADLMFDSTTATNNHCRIHARYAKRGLATKIRFPPDVSVGGVSNCNSGAWFYTIQGIFELLFEHHTREVQLNIIPALMDLWKSDERALPTLPESLTVGMKRLINTSNFHERQLHARELLTSCSYTMDAMQCWDRQPSKGVFVGPEKKSANVLCDDLLVTARSVLPVCIEPDKVLMESVVAFIQLVHIEAVHRDDNLLRSFFDLVGDLAVLATEQKPCGNADGWNLSARQDIFLRVVCEWLGRNLSLFADSISAKANAFKAKHLKGSHEIPTLENVVEELFPPCMILLIGNWMGLYASESSPEDSRDRSSAGDHCYSTTGLESGSDRRIELTSKSTMTLPSTRKDHTYVMNELPLRLKGCAFNREDHTYVSLKGDDGDRMAAVVTSDRKRRRLERVTARTCSDIRATLHSSRVPLAQLVLEIVNNVLVSGVAHVVYARLLQPS